MVKVEVDFDTCIGCAACNAVCSEVFDMKDNKAVVKKVSSAVLGKPCVKEAKDVCPVAAIKLK